jgi:hypothetical protein
MRIMYSELQNCLTIEEFADWHRIGRTTVYAEIKAGRLKVRQVGKRRIITPGRREVLARSAAHSTRPRAGCAPGWRTPTKGLRRMRKRPALGRAGVQQETRADHSNAASFCLSSPHFARPKTPQATTHQSGTQDAGRGRISDMESTMSDITASNDQFGYCPICHKTDGYADAGKSQVFYCLEHKTSWSAGDWGLGGPEETLEEQLRIWHEIGLAGGV